MTLSELKRDCMLIASFKNCGYVTRNGSYSLYQVERPDVAYLFCKPMATCDVYYLYTRVYKPRVEVFNSYVDAISEFRDFVSAVI